MQEVEVHLIATLLLQTAVAVAVAAQAALVKMFMATQIERATDV